MKKQEKEQTYKFFGFNIKLLSNQRKGENAYFNLIQDIYEKDIIEKVALEKAMTLRTQFSKKILWKEKSFKILYGKITRFTLLEGNNWYNTKKKEIQNVDAPLDVFPNGFETDYYFFPDAHRFYIRLNPKVSINNTIVFLQAALKGVVESNEDFSVHIIQSEDAIEQILSALELQLLRIEVTYTNDDIGKEAQELIDDLLKEGQIGQLNALIKPDQNGTLDTQSDFVKGLLEISKENGTAEATIKDFDGKRKKIITHKYPEKVHIQSKDENDIISRLFFQIMKTYRND